MLTVQTNIGLKCPNCNSGYGACATVSDGKIQSADTCSRCFTKMLPNPNVVVIANVKCNKCGMASGLLVTFKSDNSSVPTCSRCDNFL